MALATQLTCDTCHAGAGTGTTTHYTNANARVGVPTGPATVAIDIAFTAKTGGNPTFTGASLTCSNVSCHGGQTTPGWQNGTINSGTQCTVCHAVAASIGTTTQFNDAFGRHSIGTHNATTAANNIACTTCHNMGNGSPGALAHFKYLDTQAVDGTATGTPADQLPSGTIIFDPLIVTGAGTYTVTSSTQGNGGCALTCHTHIHAGAPLDTWLSSGAPHPVPFLGGQATTQGDGHLNATQATFTSDCSACHAYTGTSPIPGAPLCSVCHALADPTLPASGVGTCLSCHAGTSGMPVGPTGTTFPSIAGAHGKHMALLTTLSCNTCHTGSGAGTTTHYNNANARIAAPVGPASVAIDATFNAQSAGTAVFNPSSITCSNTSCHGGQTTPNWRTGTITSTSQCSLCHAINGGTTTSQFNDATGRHSYGTHFAAGTLDCTICHDMTSANTNAGAVRHFAELDTPAVSSTNKLPSGTIKFTLTNATYPITGAATYDVTTSPFTEGDGGCALTCHSQAHVPATNHWNAAKGSGVAHPVPFLSTSVSAAGYSHQTVTLAQFNLECTTCHDQSGTTVKTGPVCTVCHTLGSPLATGMTAGTCLSCHTGATFPVMGPTGTTWPNLAGAHPKHLALLTFTRTTPALPATLTASAYPDCEACHVGSVPYDPAQTHYSNANKRSTTPISAGPASVSIDPTFNSQASTAGTSPSASAFTCSNISCHGGQVTPGWQTGTNPVNATTYCTACHVVNAAEYNAPTGRHNSPGEHKQTCDYCHDMTQAKAGAQNHFKYLDTTVVSGVSGTPADQYPSDTILFGSSVTGAKTYTVTSTTQGKGGCALTCHSQNHTATGNKWN
jgi:predicted CxxxxCH...CXXCH cytochrome family protein